MAACARAGAAAVTLPSPYQGSDTLFNVTAQAIAAAGLTPTNAYVGGGSGNAEAAMNVNANAAQAKGLRSCMRTIIARHRAHWRRSRTRGRPLHRGRL